MPSTESAAIPVVAVTHSSRLRDERSARILFRLGFSSVVRAGRYNERTGAGGRISRCLFLWGGFGQEIRQM